MDNVSLFFLVFGLNNHSQAADTLMVFGAQYLIYLTFLLVFVLSFKGGVKERKSMLLAILALPILILIIKGIHIFFYEPRPFVSYNFSPLIPYGQDASFPSRHVSFMSGIAFAYAYFKSKWAPLFFLLLAWVGLARIYVGVHYPLDILGGIVVGITSLIITEYLIRKLRIRFPFR